MTQTSEQLQTKIAELEEENARLIREVVNRNQRTLDGDKAVKAADALYEQLANAEQRVAEAIAEYCRNQDHYCLATEIESGAWKEFKK